MRSTTIALILMFLAFGECPASGSGPEIQRTAARVDHSLWGDRIDESVPLCDDATFLRRSMFDIVGRPATPGEITRFGLDPSPNRRNDVVRKLLTDAAYGQNWARYWRDAIFRRATNMRAGIVRPAFEDWMASQLNEKSGWDKIVTALLTASGPVNGNGQTALLFAHEGTAEEVAAEASRLFLGIQIQCANCHDHPWDSWKRLQFHQFTAFFPRVSVQRDRRSDNLFDFEIVAVDSARNRNPVASQFLLTRMDRNRDSVISEQEAKGSPISRIFGGPAKDVMDRNGDGKLTIEEILTAQPPDRPGQGATEHFMPDLNDPGSEGTRIDPAFFLNAKKVAPGLSDSERRVLAADLITRKSNVWFSRALVNRIWYEMTGTAFYTPVDDLGPDRECMHEETLTILADGFAASGFDIQWLISTIAATRTYQRKSSSTAEGFARCEPIRLRSDQLYAALCQTLGVTALPLRLSEGRRSPAEMRKLDPGREEFSRIFGFDPSTPRDELTGSIPEALFLMNSELLTRIISSSGDRNVISRISGSVLAEEDVVREIYLNTLGREPAGEEMSIASDHISSASSFREGLEDLQWALINSPEFCSRR